MTAQAPVLRTHGNSYSIFILVLTIFSLAIMVLLLLPVTPAEHDLLLLYDNAVCFVFLIDFAVNLTGAKPTRAYFIGRLTGVFVMFAGIGIIGALASILASMLVPPATPAEPAPEAESTSGVRAVDATASGAVAEELAAIRAELAALR